MREIKISQETASRWYNGTDSELKALALQTYPELAVKELPKTWEELGIVDGYVISSFSKIRKYKRIKAELDGRNTFSTEEQASAAIAMAQLSQLMAVYNGSWVADWNDGNIKYCIYFQNEKHAITQTIIVRSFINFKDRKTAELFLENFSSLINTAKPLL